MTASSGVASLLSRYRRRTQASSIAYTSAERPVPSSWPIRMRGTYWCVPRPGRSPAHMGGADKAKWGSRQPLSLRCRQFPAAPLVATVVIGALAPSGRRPARVRRPRPSLVLHRSGHRHESVSGPGCFRGVAWECRERSVRRFVGLRRSRRFLFFRPARAKGAVFYGHLDHGGGRRGDDRADRVLDSSAQRAAPASASASGALRPRSGRVRRLRGPGASTGRVVPPVETVQPAPSLRKPAPSLRKGEPRAAARPGGSGDGSGPGK